MWNYLPQYYLNRYGKNLAILTFNFINEKQFPRIKQIPLFYQEVIIAFNKSKGSNKPTSKTEFLDNIIWGNRHFIPCSKQNNQETLYNKHWIECGIL